MDRRDFFRWGGGAAGAAAMAATTGLVAAEAFETQMGPYRVRLVPLAQGLDHPWGIAFVPGGDILVTERAGRLRILRDGRLQPRPLGGVPRVLASGQGGLLDVALHPDFGRNKLVYLTFASGTPSANRTVLARGRLGAGRLDRVEILFRSQPDGSTTKHFGSRIAFSRFDHLFLTVGDRFDQNRAQNLGWHHGKVIRLFPDGRVPPTNPFVRRPGARPEIFAFGLRNPQGLVFRPGTNELFECEHGPQGGDEINIIRKGKNYGWPIYSFGCDYGTNPATCRPYGGGIHRNGTAGPIKHWTPSIAPSGIGFYTGNLFPAWRGDLFVAALKFRLLARLELDATGKRVTGEQRMLEGRLGRIRHIKAGPDGRLYVLTDAPNGGVWAISRA